MKRYVKLPIPTQCVQFTSENRHEICKLVGHQSEGESDTAPIPIQTLEGPIFATLGDWVAQGINGEFWAIKPDIFFTTYVAEETLLNSDDLINEFARLKAELHHWKANHCNQVSIKSAILDRPDLGDRAKKVQKLVKDNEALRRIIEHMYVYSRRYCDGRMTYAPGDHNRLIKEAMALGCNFLPDPTVGTVYAEDGSWPSIEKMPCDKVFVNNKWYYADPVDEIARLKALLKENKHAV